MIANEQVNAVDMSKLVLGCARLGSILTPLNRRESVHLLRQAVDLGIRQFDTAPIYGQGDSERFLGLALATERDRFVIATKAGQRFSSGLASARPLKLSLRLLSKHLPPVHRALRDRRTGAVEFCFDAAFVMASLDESLRRLQTEFVDIFYLHSPPLQELTSEKLAPLADTLQRSGKIRRFGVSCDDASLALAAVAIECVDVIQFSSDDAPLSARILEAARRHGKQVYLRGLTGSLLANDAVLHHELRATMSSADVGGIIFGTTRVDHLRHNVGLICGDRRDAA